MRRSFTALLGCMALFVTTFAQSPEYGRVLFRVNTGGEERASIDTSDVAWVKDDATNPCPYFDTIAMGNKTSATEDSIAHDASVPATTPYQIFKTDRGFMKWDINKMQFDFPVESGKRIEVRLYFAEIYFDNADARVFDIMIEDNVVLNDFDIFASVGKNVGVMKSFEAVSDGNLDVDLRRVKQQPVISAIEIIEIKSGTIASIFNKQSSESLASVYPNPFPESFTIKSDLTNIERIRIYDYSGKEIETAMIKGTSNHYTVDLSSEPKGIYFLQYSTQEDVIEMKKIIKY